MLESERPLSDRLRPKDFEEFFGQAKIWAENTPLYRLATQDKFFSLIFWGPPGTGKTTLANLIGKQSGRLLVGLSAAHATVKEMRDIMIRSEIKLNHGEKGYLIFMDEIHRLSRSQQDILLPAVESGVLKLIGATTENPSVTVNNALLSRSLVFQFERHSPSDLRKMVEGALIKNSRSLPEVIINAVVEASNGDGRQALNLTEAILVMAPEIWSKDLERSGEDQDYSWLEPMLGKKIFYDKKEELHYDIISAFIKSIRASDADAGIYYLARMIEGGEDPLFIARRLIILASEDVGNANPNALVFANAAYEAVRQIGMPEGRIVLAQAVTYLSGSPKSNRSYLAIKAAQAEVQKSGNLEVPLHLRNAPTKFMAHLGYGKDYVYAHDDPSKAANVNNLPDGIAAKYFYDPSESGAEKNLGENLKRVKFVKK